MRAIIATALIGALLLAGCGGGGSNVGAQAPPPAGPADNVQALTVDSGPAALASAKMADANTLFTTVTICVPGSTTSCQTIDHVQVDTGSSGLRILGSVLTLSLPLQTGANGNPVGECIQFVDGFSWGPVRKADMQISGESAAGIAVQVIGDPAYQAVPSACASSSGGNAEDTVVEFGANGILGVGPFISDCGSACATVPNPIYYTCPSSTTCQNVAMAVAQQVSNPVSFFATDNNGVIIELPSVSATGAASVSGSLVFGIGTQGNNGLGSATVFTLSTADGSLTTQYAGKALTDSFIDSGSNGFFFPDSTIHVCTDNPFYCPLAPGGSSTTLNLSGTIEGQNNASSSVSFSIANADTLFSQSIAAASNLGGPSTSTSAFDGTKSFDWGLPFHFGRNVFTAIETRNTSGGEGPYFAF